MNRVPPVGTRKLLETVSRSMAKHLPGSPAEEYLKGRGISKKAQSYFRLGFAENVPPEFKEYEGMLSIPYIVGNWTVGIKFRRLDDMGTRYISNHGFYGKRFFNPQTLMGLDTRIYVCEGEIDTITLWQLGVPAIGVPGANNWDPIMGRALRNREVVVLVDGKGKSEEGRKAGLTFAKQILTTVDEGGRIILEGTDVNGFYLDHGADLLLKEIGFNGIS